MPVDLQIIRASEFVRIDPHEHLDFEASKEALQAMATACRKRGLNRALLDLRAVPIPAQRLFNVNELSALVLTFRDAGFTQEQRLAVLCEHDAHGGVRDFAFISRMRGLQVQAFAEFEAAFEWLSDEEERREGEEPVPIGKRQPEVKRLSPAPAARLPVARTGQPVRGKKR